MMKPHDYRIQIKNDIRAYIRKYVNLEGWEGMWPAFKMYLSTILLGVDDVTGNSSGSYTKDAFQAKQNLIGNEDLILLAEKAHRESYLLHTGFVPDDETDPERLDVLVRCYLLDECIEEVIGGIVCNMDGII